MIRFIHRSLYLSFGLARARLATAAFVFGLVFAFALHAVAQQTTSPNPAPPTAPPATTDATPSAVQTPGSPAQDAAPQTATQQPATPGQDTPGLAAPPATPAPSEQTAPATPQESAPGTPPAQSASLASGAEPPGGITEDELKQMLLGKKLFLRGGYLFDSLSYNVHGDLVGRSPHASYTLCGVEITKVSLTKHKIELEGARYGLHFLGALPYEDPTKALDWVKITPKKKLVRITVDREIVIRPKKEKEEKPAKKGASGAAAKTNPAVQANAGPVVTGAPADTDAASTTKQETPSATDQAEKAAPEKTEETAAAQPPDASGAEQLKAEIAATKPEDRPADWKSITTTTSPAHATKILKQALDNVFAAGLDDRMMAGMPDFWKLYYQAVAARTDYRPADQAVLRQTTVDQKATLVSKFEPESNEYAQTNGVAGMALYHAVIGADGKPGEIAVARPIGFGLDENAVTAIRNAKFEPATKDGKPVPVLLDLVVQFRIYSKRTAVTGLPGDKVAQTPGPYTVREHAEAAPPDKATP